MILLLGVTPGTCPTLLLFLFIVERCTVLMVTRGDNACGLHLEGRFYKVWLSHRRSSGYYSLLVCWEGVCTI